MQKPIRTIRGLCFASLSVCLAVALQATGGCSPQLPRGINGPRITSIANLHDIGLALRDYQEDHGSFPPAFSSLVPHYVKATDLEKFYVTNGFSQLELPPSDWRSNPKWIDTRSAYTYLGVAGAGDVIAFEKTNLWKTGVTDTGKVAVLYSDGRVVMVPIPDIAKLFRTQ
jgi:hypothetical protein